MTLWQIQLRCFTMMKIRQQFAKVGSTSLPLQSSSRPTISINTMASPSSSWLLLWSPYLFAPTTSISVERILTTWLHLFPTTIITEFNNHLLSTASSSFFRSHSKLFWCILLFLRAIEWSHFNSEKILAKYVLFKPIFGISLTNREIDCSYALPLITWTALCLSLVVMRRV